MIEEDKVPDGDYCYCILKDNDDVTLDTEYCPYFRWRTDIDGEYLMSAYCENLNNLDIFDRLKRCGINTCDDDEYCCEFHSGKIKDWKNGQKNTEET
jgi:hypothetical protein